MYVVMHFCHFLQKQRSEKKDKEGKERPPSLITADGNKQGTAHVCWILSGKGGETISAEVPSEAAWESSPLLCNHRKRKEEKRRASPHLSVCEDSKMKRDKNEGCSLSAGLLCLLRSVCASWVNEVEKDPNKRPDRDASRKHIKREIRRRWKKGNAAGNPPVPVPSREWRSAARSSSSLGGGMCWRGWDRRNAPGTGGSSGAAAHSPSPS